MRVEITGMVGEIGGKVEIMGGEDLEDQEILGMERNSAENVEPVSSG